MLDAIVEDLGGFELIRAIGRNADIFRVWVDDEAFETAATIGPPPVEYAIQSNRMSLASIPMFYGAFDVATANVETLDPMAHPLIRPLRCVHAGLI